MANIKMNLQEPLIGGGQSITIDGVDMAATGITEIQVRAAVDETIKTVIEFDFRGHEIELTGAGIQVDGMKLPAEVEKAMFKHFAMYFECQLMENIKEYLHGDGIDEVVMENGTRYINKVDAEIELPKIIKAALNEAAERGQLPW